jgi:hypothetical protein
VIWRIEAVQVLATGLQLTTTDKIEAARNAALD